MNKRIIQFSSGKGPAECGLAVALALQEFIKECERNKIDFKVIEYVDDEMPGTFQSAIVEMKDNVPLNFIQSWIGNILWICESPFRKNHKRKNWFIGVTYFHREEFAQLNEADVEFSAMKASGPGGQHVNKTMSAVRAVHHRTGITVTVSDSRSQHENRKLALERLKQEMNKRNSALESDVKKNVWVGHLHVERGNPVRIYEGMKFKLRKKT